MIEILNKVPSLFSFIITKTFKKIGQVNFFCQLPRNTDIFLALIFTSKEHYSRLSMYCIIYGTKHQLKMLAFHLVLS